jgi:hypothetical protein
LAMGTRSEVIAGQRDFFEGKLPDDYNGNLMAALLDEDLRAFEEADGNELAAKMKAPHSSSALCVNFFRYWKRTGSTDFLRVFAEAVFGKQVQVSPSFSLRFEEKHRFGAVPDRQIVKGKSGNLDLDVRIGQTHAVLVESKFTELFSETPSEISQVNTERYLKAFAEVLLCDPMKLLSAGRERKFYQLAQRLLYTVDNLDPAFRAIPSRAMLFLYYDYDDFDRDLCRFPELVKPQFSGSVVVMSYQTLFKRLVDALSGGGHDLYFDYMSRRYFRSCSG